MDTLPAGNRARRALPLIAAALAAIVIAGLVYLRPTVPAAAVRPAQSPQPAILDQRYDAEYSFVTPSLGWALVFDAIGFDASVFNTTDGARHWSLQKFGMPAAEGLLRIRFFDRTTGFVTLGNAGTYRTTDGGRDWSLVTRPSGAAADLWFVDPSHGWFQSDNQFESTADGGLTWQALPAPPVVGALDFADARNGWLANGGDQAVAAVYSTDDGGASWTRHVIEGSFGRVVQGLFALPRGGVLVVMQDESAATSFDGGATWYGIAQPPGENSYMSIGIQDGTHWWAMRQGDLYKTSDAGRSWVNVSLQLDSWEYSPTVLDTRHAWAKLRNSPGAPLSGTALAMTSDGGIHWSYRAVPRVS